MITFHSKITGFSDLEYVHMNEYVLMSYEVIGDACCIKSAIINGISNSNDLAFSLPFVAKKNTVHTTMGVDNGVKCVVMVSIEADKNLAICYKRDLGGTFTSSGRKSVSIGKLCFDI